MHHGIELVMSSTSVKFFASNQKSVKEHNIKCLTCTEILNILYNLMHSSCIYEILVLPFDTYQKMWWKGGNTCSLISYSIVIALETEI